MRRVSSWHWTATGLVLGAIIAAGCGGEERVPPAPPAAPPTVIQGAADDSDVYELDVIAEAEPDEGAPPLTVNFLGYIEEDEGGPWVFQWEFGDGAKSDEQNPVHTYTEVGDYLATFTVTDQKKNTGSDEIDIFVEPDDY